MSSTAQGGGRRSWWDIPAVLFLVLVAVCVLGANPFAGQTTGPFDVLMARPAWNPEFQQVGVRSGERTDVLDAMLPRWMYARNELRSGRIPLWNPLPGGGESGIHNLASSQLSPAFAVFTLAPSPASGLYAATLLNLVVAGVGVWLWLRRRAGTLPALFGAVTMMLCGFHAAWLYWPHMSTAVWAGWLLWAVEGWWRRPGAGWFLALVGSTSLLILGGFPFVAELTLGAALLYAMALWYCDRPSHVTARWTGQLASMALAIGLIAIPVMSFTSWLGHVDTAGRSGGSPFSLYPDALRLLPHYAREHASVEGQMYVGGLGLALAMAGLLSLAGGVRRNPLQLFGAVALAVAVTLVFELVPAAWLGWVPGLGGNGWSRSIFLLDLALAVLAACALARLLAWLGSKWVAGLVAVPLILLQALDLGASFRQFNGPQPSAWMFPQTPALAVAEQAATPFTYVIGDHNYIVSGTLGAYGLAEWYGHGFKSPELKRLLEKPVRDPFTTPTASVIPSSAIDLGSSELAALGIRHLLGDERLVADLMMPDYAAVDGPMEALPPFGSTSWVQHIAVPGTFLLGHLDVRLATYEATDVPGIIRALLTNTRSGELVASSALPASVLVDGEMARFRFSPTALAPGDYTLQLVHEGAAVDRPLTAWMLPGKTTNCRLEAAPLTKPGCLVMQLSGDRPGIENWQVIHRHRGLVVLENQRAPRGPYFLASLDEKPDAAASEQVRARGDFSHGWTLDYAGTAPGFLVLPMSFTRSWVYRVNGEPVTPQRYLGVMPALPVGPGSVVQARYEPISVRHGRWIMLGSALATLGIACGLFIGRRRIKTTTVR